MAEPVTMMAAATAMKAAGDIYGGISAKKSADINAGVLRDNAASTRAAAGQAEDAQRRNARQVLGQQRAAIAQAGVGFGGSAADIMEQSSAAAELDALTARYEGETRARAMENDAKVTQYQGKRARIAGFLGGGGSLLTGTANYQANK